MAKVLIADQCDQKTVRLLKESGYEVRMDPSITEATLATEIKDYNILIVRSKKVNRAAIEAANALSIIVRAGAGVNTIDVNAAAEKGIYVCNTPGCNNDAVAELAMGHIIACDRQICANTAHLRAGEWRKKLFLTCEGLRDHTLGIIGRGNIAKSLINIAKGMHMKIIVWSRSFSPEEAKALGVEYAATPLDVAKVADAVSVHISYNKEQTHHFINAEFFNAMKDGAIFVNTSRGEVVDTAAMLEAIKNKKLKVGLDVYEGEPAASMGEFPHKDLANAVCSCTCHIGASTNQAGDVIADATVDVVNTFVREGKAKNCVNLNCKPAADGTLMVRHTGVLADIIAVCAKNNAQILSVNNCVLKGDKAQSLTLTLKCDHCFKEEVAAIPGVLGVGCAPSK